MFYFEYQILTSKGTFDNHIHLSSKNKVNENRAIRIMNFRLQIRFTQIILFD